MIKSLILVSIAVGVILVAVTGLANQDTSKKTRFDDDDDDNDEELPSPEEAPIFYGE
jgi:hypothetical protein